MKEIHSSEWAAEVLKASFPVLVDFWAPWCGPCRMLAPVLEQLSESPRWAGKVSIVKLNVDDNPEVANRYEVRALPTLLVFKNGIPVGQLVGSQSKSSIEAFLEKHIAV